MVEEILKDANGRRLETGFYLYNNPLFLSGTLCYIEVYENGKSFSAEDALNGYLSITDFSEAAKSFIQIGKRDTMRTNIRFALNKLEKLAQK